MMLNVSFLLMWIWQIFPSTWEKLQDYRTAEHIADITKPGHIRAIEALVPLPEEVENSEASPNPNRAGSVRLEREGNVRKSILYLNRKKLYNRLRALRLVRLMQGRRMARFFLGRTIIWTIFGSYEQIVISVS